MGGCIPGAEVREFEFKVANLSEARKTWPARVSFYLTRFYNAKIPWVSLAPLTIPLKSNRKFCRKIDLNTHLPWCLRADITGKDGIALTGGVALLAFSASLHRLLNLSRVEHYSWHFLSSPGAPMVAEDPLVTCVRARLWWIPLNI